ncbi:MAG: phosphotransferase [Deinococcales bacterium]
MRASGPPVLDVSRARGGVPYRSHGSRRGARWILPAGGPLASSARRLYQPTALRGHLRRLLMEWRFGGESLLLDGGILASWESALAQAVGAPEVHLAFYVGNATVLGKTAVLAMDSRGRPLGIAKATMEPHAADALRNEWRVLQQLSHEPVLEGRVPAPLALMDHRNHTVLVTSVGPGRRGPTRFEPAHTAWLEALGRPYRRETSLQNSEFWMHVTRGFDDLRGGLNATWQARYETALASLQDVLDGVPMQVSLVHRDFTPWNTRCSSHGLYVFDFELARWGFPVAIDWYHFHFMTSLLLDGGANAAAARSWVAGWASHGTGARGAGPGHGPVAGARTPAAMLLAYLVDVGLEYHRFQAILGETDDDPVLTQTGHLLDTAAEWWG